MGFRTRKGKLENKLKEEIGKSHPSLERVVEIVEDYEKDNLKTIEKLKKKKEVDTKRITGAIRQTINAHGPITKQLIGSATKRIHGALLTNVTEGREKKYSVKSLIIGFMFGLTLSGILLLLLLW